MGAHGGLKSTHHPKERDADMGELLHQRIYRQYQDFLNQLFDRCEPRLSFIQSSFFSVHSGYLPTHLPLRSSVLSRRFLTLSVLTICCVISFYLYQNSASIDLVHLNRFTQEAFTDIPLPASTSSNSFEHFPY